MVRAEKEQGAPAEPPEIGLNANPYQLTMAGMVLPVPLHIGFNAFAALCAVLLGHPVVAAWGFITCCGVDWTHQTLIARWLKASVHKDPAGGFRALGHLVALRVSIYLAPAVAMAASGRVAEVAYLGVVACTIVALACANGSLSLPIFWSFATPAVAAIAVAGLITLHGAQIVALGIGLATLTLLLALIAVGTTRTVSAWQEAFNANRALIPELEAARDRALAERLAADEAREEARRANRAKSNFLATMSHEIRTPMNGVLGMAQLLKRDEIDPAQSLRLETLIESGEYLLSILNDILDVSKIDAGRLEIVRHREDLRQFLHRAVGFWGARAEERGVALRIEMADEVPQFAWMDALRLRQILFNLVGNALKFTETGSVTVRAEARPRGASGVWLQVAVRDTGPGISPEHLPCLFDRFSQGDDSEARRFGGTGLGLAIAKQLTELMGGRISVDSELGHGSTFRIELPLDLADAPGEAADAAEAAEAAEHQQVPALDALIVDDNPVNLLVLDQLLSAFGHRAIKAASGAEALDLLAIRPFDLVLMDIQMPGMTGVEALRRLRAAPGPNRQIPVIALTADVTSGGRQHYLGLGFTEHGSKPLQIPDLMAAISRAVSADAPSDRGADEAARRA